MSQTCEGLPHGASDPAAGSLREAGTGIPSTPGQAADNPVGRSILGSRHRRLRSKAPAAQRDGSPARRPRSAPGSASSSPAAALASHQTLPRVREPRELF